MDETLTPKRKESWVMRALSRPIIYMTGYDRRWKKDLVWMEITEAQLRDIQSDMYRGLPRFRSLRIYRDNKHDFN